MIIKDLVAGVTKKLRDRDDLASDIPVYIKKAILDLSQNYELEELRETGPITNFEMNKAEYPLQGNDCPFIVPSHLSITFIVSLFVWFTSNITLGVSTGFEMKYRAPRVVNPLSKTLGIPTYYTQVGRKLLVGFMPNDDYQCQMRYQRQHPFLADTKLSASTIYMPDDWQDIIEYAAAEKACDDVGMNDVGQLYHAKLFGNPMKKSPGLITERYSQQQRQSVYNERQLRPVVRKY